MSVNSISQIRQTCPDDYALAYVPQELVQNDITSGTLLTALAIFQSLSRAIICIIPVA